MSSFITYSLFFGILFFIFGFIKNRPKIKKAGANLTTFTTIYLLTALFGPAKYTVDLTQSPIYLNDTKLALVWETNRIFPFESIATPYYMGISRTTGENSYLRVSEDTAKSLKRNYKREPFYIQYLFYILIFFWYITKKYLLKNLSSDSQDRKPSGELSRESIRKCDSLEQLNIWLTKLEKTPFYRPIYKSKYKRLCNKRYQELRPQLAKAFYLVASELANRSSRESSFGKLPLWIAEQVIKGHSTFALNITFTSNGERTIIKDFAQYLRTLKNDATPPVNEYKKVFMESRQPLTLSKEIKPHLINQLSATLLSLSPTGLFTFTAHSTNKINLQISLNDYDTNQDSTHHNVSFSVNNIDYSYLSPSISLTASLSQGSTLVHPPYKINITQPPLQSIFRQLLQATKNSLNASDTSSCSDNETPKPMALVFKLRLIFAVIQSCVSQPSTTGNGVKSSSKGELQELYLALADGMKSAIIGEFSADIASSFLESNPQLVNAVLGSALVTSLSLDIDENLLATLGGMGLASLTELAIG